MRPIIGHYPFTSHVRLFSSSSAPVRSFFLPKTKASSYILTAQLKRLWPSPISRYLYLRTGSRPSPHPQPDHQTRSARHEVGELKKFCGKETRPTVRREEGYWATTEDPRWVRGRLVGCGAAQNLIEPVSSHSAIGSSSCCCFYSSQSHTISERHTHTDKSHTRRGSRIQHRRAKSKENELMTRSVYFERNSA